MLFFFKPILAIVVAMHAVGQKKMRCHNFLLALASVQQMIQLALLPVTDDSASSLHLEDLVSIKYIFPDVASKSGAPN